jgi:hypothetical protein
MAAHRKKGSQLEQQHLCLLLLLLLLVCTVELGRAVVEHVWRLVGFSRVAVEV